MGGGVKSRADKLNFRAYWADISKGYLIKQNTSEAGKDFNPTSFSGV